jgi:hypothetical protein
LNAILNLIYKLAEVEARLACVAVGLDPGLGFVHADIAHRDSLALDLLETIRPAVDRFVLDLVAERTFTRADFVERSDGSIRIAPRLVQECAATMPAWARAVAPHAEGLAHLLGRAITGKWQPTTKLSGRKAHVAQAEVKARKLAATNASNQAEPARARARPIRPVRDLFTLRRAAPALPARLLPTMPRPDPEPHSRHPTSPRSSHRRDPRRTRPLESRPSRRDRRP